MFCVTYRRGNVGGGGGGGWCGEEKGGVLDWNRRLSYFSAFIYCNPGVNDAFQWFVLSSGVKMTDWGKEECSPIFVNRF
jgi:hypothetical protein